MYYRKGIVIFKIIAAILSVILELSFFYYLFSLFENVLMHNNNTSVIQHDILFYLALTTLSVWIHELTSVILDLGDKLEQRGEPVWKTPKHKNLYLIGGASNHGREQL